MIPHFKMKHRFNGGDTLELMAKDGILTPTTCAVGLPCLQKIAENPHPAHFDRIELVVWLKAMGYRDMAIISFRTTNSCQESGKPSKALFETRAFISAHKGRPTTLVYEPDIPSTMNEPIPWIA